jgi:Na+/melibiose symporter-like transporter
MALFIPAFYAGELGVPLSAVGAALAGSRLLDVFTDPLLGTLSDRLPTRWGRRKPWIALGTPVFVVGLWNVFVPAPGADGWSLLLWSAVLYLGFTMVDLPHKAWGAELSTRYDERSRITSWREGLSAFGQVALLGSLLWLGQRGVTEAPEQLYGLAITVLVGLPVLVALSFLVPESPARIWGPSPGPVEGLRLVVRNPAFLRVIACTVLFVSGVAVQGTLHRLVLTDVMGTPETFIPMILAENLATLLLVPAWLAVSMRVEKHQALMGAAAWLALLSLPLVFLRAGDTMGLVAVITLRGSSFASLLFLSSSLAADVIDLDTVASGSQRSGLFFAVWGMATKLSLAIGVLLGTALPAALGYVPGAVLDAEVASSVMGVYGAVPAALMGLGALSLYGFPVTRARQALLRVEIDALSDTMPGNPTGVE